MIGFALSGRAGSGKSTLSRAIVAELRFWGCPARRIAFADPLKAEVLELYGVTKEDEGGREKLIEHGEARREADPLYWIRQLDARVDDLIGLGLVPVIDDMRVPDEFEWAWAKGFCTVRVNSPVHLRVARLIERGEDGAFAVSKNITETALESTPHDVFVSNLRDPLKIAHDARDLVIRRIPAVACQQA